MSNIILYFGRAPNQSFLPFRKFPRFSGHILLTEDVSNSKNCSTEKNWSYTADFKVKAVKLSYQPNVQVKQVAEALDIHPFMLSRWRKEYREGKLQGDGLRRVGVSKKKVISGKQLSEFEKLKKENARLKKENDLLKKWQRYLAEQHQNDLDSSRDTETLGWNNFAAGLMYHPAGFMPGKIARPPRASWMTKSC